MSYDRKAQDFKYKNKMKDTGYVRVHKWCPMEFKGAIYAVIDILSCHHEDPSSTVDFAELISEVLISAARYESEYEVKNERKNDSGKE